MKQCHLLLSVLCTLFLCSAAWAGDDGWLTSWEAAAKQSKATGKPILMDFTGSDWCVNCKLLHKEVFDTKEFKDWAAKARAEGKPVMIAFLRPDVSAWSTRLQSEVFDTKAFSSWVSQKVVPLKVDLSNAQGGTGAEGEAAKVELARKYGVVGFPTVVLVDADGKALGSLRYIAGGAGPWIARADEVLAGKEPAELPWLQTWEQAAEASRSSGKPIMMDFTGSDWCVFCVKLKHEVFQTQAFRDWAAAKVVLLEVDFPRSFDLDPALISQNEGLGARYSIQGFPTIVFAKPSGEMLGSLGYSEGGPAVWLKSAELAMAGKPAAKP